MEIIFYYKTILLMLAKETIYTRYKRLGNVRVPLYDQTMYIKLC